MLYYIERNLLIQGKSVIIYSNLRGIYMEKYIINYTIDGNEVKIYNNRGQSAIVKKNRKTAEI